MSEVNMVSISGGKDSTATLALAIALEVPNIVGIFADTGHESPFTYDYVDYLERVSGVAIVRVRADFTKQIARKREIVQTKWREEGVSEAQIEEALAVLQPTGNPFLDLCLWKGRFPSTMARFCSEELKRNPIIEYQMPLLDAGHTIYSWQGVRADESPSRARLAPLEEVGGGLWNYRPILRWNVHDVFEAHAAMGWQPNHLYKQGMGRVGCMPCIHARKNEIREISKRFPEEVERVARWEQMVAKASRRGTATFFAADKADAKGLANEDVSWKTHGIHAIVEWTKTTKDRRQYDLVSVFEDTPACSSIYGLCARD